MAKKKDNILLTGAAGQLGIELTARLREQTDVDKIVLTDIRHNQALAENGIFETLDVLDKDRLWDTLQRHKINRIYHLAAILSASGESNIMAAWKLNMDGLLNVLDTAREINGLRVFWPSSIAVFGSDAQRQNTPQDSPLNPSTAYGISKVAGEQWCAYYHRRFGVDVRSVRYPGLIGYRSKPGGGTTDYAVEIFHAIHSDEPYSCPLQGDTRLPMMYMDDAVRAAIELMEARPDDIRIRTSYNLAAISFTPREITEEIRRYDPGFQTEYEPDHREEIASSWPESIDDRPAREQWGWDHEFDLKAMVRIMIHQ